MLMMSNNSEKIIQLRTQGWTYKEICEELNCAMSTVSYHCKLNKLGGHNDRLTDEQKIELQKLYDEIGNLKKIAKLKGHSFETVQKYVQKKNRTKKVSNSEAVILWRKRTKLKLVESKGGKCQICGYNKSINALHFHHLDPNEKDFTISGKSVSFEKLKKEVDKCVLVCSNCHSEIHEGLVKI
jgi:5-methylcytosine-specific restriction endonuclease McrA